MNDPAPARRLWYLLIPALTGLCVCALRCARGPHWFAANLDPDYCYLLNSVSIAELNAPGHYHHPGTTVQMAGACVVRIAHLLTGTGTLRQDVLSAPEF